MSRIGRLAGLTGATVLALAAMSAPAQAATTIVGVPYTYDGDVQATLISNITVHTTLLGTTTCTSSTLTGSSPANGSSLSVSSATFGGCSGTGNPTLTAVNTGTWGGSVVATANGIGTLTITNFTVQANVTIPIVNINVNCTYKGTVTAAVSGNSVTNGAATAVLNTSTISKDSGSAFCPGNADLTGGTYRLKGDSVGNDKVYTNDLDLRI